tara:strand:- start:2388 stop:2954 length:567 start_codon:yes stop_codon:yes gene_type:complete
MEIDLLGILPTNRTSLLGGYAKSSAEAGCPLNMSISITLETGEIETAKMIAKGRLRANVGVFNRQRSPEPPEDVEMNGMGAEMAYCKAFNLWPDLTVTPRSGGADCTHGNRTVDVKATGYANGKLLVTPDKKDKGTDLYVLVTGWMPNYTIVGYATSDEIFNDDNLAETGHGVSYVLPQEKLHDLKNT